MPNRTPEDACRDAYACLAHGIAHAYDELDGATVGHILASIALDLAADPDGWRRSIESGQPLRPTKSAEATA